MGSHIKRFFTLMAVAVSCLAGCQDGLDTDDPDKKPEDEKPESGISNIRNTYDDRTVSYRGETISIGFDVIGDWEAEIKLKDEPDGEWARISNASSGAARKNCTIRIVFEENEDASERTAELWVSVEGYEPECVATLVQAENGTSADAEINRALNTYMHEILKEDYLFNEAYNAQEVDLTVSYSEFLATHLLSLGDENIADGGYYRPSHEYSGQRFIYTNLVEVEPLPASASMRPYASQTGGLGFGPFISTALSDDGSADMGIAVSYVRRGSPAESAGLRRGDIIYSVNNTRLTTSNYRNFMTSLYAGPSGTYSFSFLRFEDNGDGRYALNAYDSGFATAGVYVYDPVLHASIMTYPEDESIKIGYLVYESFDLNSQDILEETISEFAEAGITDMILDLRFNAGGAVAQSRWLSGCIAGEANADKTFTKVVYHDGKEETWTFQYGYNNDTDPLGRPDYLGLQRLYVIASYNTASAAELVISSLRGVDFPVKIIGCRTEGKNVGMTVSETTYDGRRFQFSPVTFWVRNAKGWGDYADGIEPDEYVNNDNGSWNDDADNVFPYSFSDWGNMDYNIALQWAYCDITGKARWTNAPEASGKAASLVPMEVQMPVQDISRTGNRVYSIIK